MQHNNCPHCNYNLIGDPVPQESIDKGYYEEGAHWRKEIGLYDIDLDVTIAYRCPECGGEWWRNGDLREGPSYSLGEKKSIKP